MSRPLRSPAFTHGRNVTGARVRWRATGMGADDFGTPIVAIANSALVCESHDEAVAKILATDVQPGHVVAVRSIGLIEDGDEIEIDVASRLIRLNVPVCGAG